MVEKKKRSKSKKNVKEKLYEVMLEYYSMKLSQEKAKQESDILLAKQETIQEREFEKMKNKFIKLLDDPDNLAQSIFEIIKENWDIYEGSPLQFVLVKEFFRKKGIDIEKILPYDSFGLVNYSLEPKQLIAYKQLDLKINSMIKNFTQKIQMNEIEQKVERFYQMALSKGYFEVSQSIIKMIASELKEEIARGEIGVLTNSVSSKLLKKYGQQKRGRTRTLTKSIKIEVFKRDNYTCQECGVQKGNETFGENVILHCHHILPVNRGGPDDMSNLITLCQSCNEAIGDRYYIPGIAQIEVICNSCNSKVKIRRNMEGETYPCPRCGHEMEVPFEL